MSSSPQHHRAFLAVVEAGSITAAARELRLPRATVSRAVSRLESDLGVQLMHRTTRQIRITSTGQQLYERMKPLLESWDAVERDLRSDTQDVRGAVRISVLPLMAARLAPMIATVLEAHPELQIEVVSSVRLVDLRSEGFDIAIWAGEPRDAELVTRTVASDHVGLVASPHYLATRGRPRTVGDLTQHALLRGHSGSSRPRIWWPRIDGGRFRVSGQFVTNDAALLRRAAIEGRGITLLSDLNCGTAIHDQVLERVLVEDVGTTARLRLFTVSRTSLPTRVRVVVDALTAGIDSMVKGLSERAVLRD